MLMFKQCNQFRLIPQDYKSFLWEGHELIILEEIINELDLTEIIESYSNHSRWTSAYDPRMLLKVLFYGYMNQTFSSRKIANKLKSDLAFMYLAGDNTPNFRTINNFRKEKLSMLEGIFVQIVLKAKELWLISFWTISIDWTKIYASASRDKNNTVEGLDKEISKLFKEAEKIDEIEDKNYGEGNSDKIPEELKTKEGREKRKKEIEEKRKKIEEKKEKVKKEIEVKKGNWIIQERINETDPDSRLMMMKRKDWWNWYNPQNATEKQFIITTRVPNSANDTKELIPVLKKIEEKYKIIPKKVLADKWYWTEENYKYWESKKIESYIPHPKQAWAKLEEYSYDKNVDEYEDLDGNKYRFKQYYWNLKSKKKWRPKKDVVSKDEDFQGKTYMTELEDWKKKYLNVSKNLKSIYKRNDDRLYSTEGKEIYRKRSWCVENVFWNIKMNLKFERFSLRGFSGVQIEWNLISLAHNLQKIIRFQKI